MKFVVIRTSNHDDEKRPCDDERLTFEEYEKEIAFLVSTIDKMAETLATVSGFFDKEEIKNRYYYSSADGECGE